MLFKLWNTLLKEILLLWRDLGGIVIIFIMPVMLIITVTLIQDSTFKNFENTKIPIIVIDNDKGKISNEVLKSIKESKAFEIITKKEDQKYNEESAKKAVFNGDYQLAIVIPEHLSTDLDKNIDYKVNTVIESLGYNNGSNVSKPTLEKRNINLYFDPATNLSFKNGIKNTIDKMIFKIENQKIYSAFQQQLGTEASEMEQTNFINFKEILPSGELQIKPSSVQHNVPAWALFAIFFIVVPLSINLVKEKDQGTMLRIISSPTPYYIHIIGKTITYLLICLIQFFTMLLVGKYIFPHLGLASFEIGNQLPLMIIVTIFAGLAAIGLGILIGTVANTQEQSAPFGATFIVVLAAIGGIWVPVFMMPEFMQNIAKYSPMNWGLTAYYDIILRNGDIISILKECGLLFLFYITMIIASLIYYKKQHEV